MSHAVVVFQRRWNIFIGETACNKRIAFNLLQINSFKRSTILCVSILFKLNRYDSNLLEKPNLTADKALPGAIEPFHPTAIQVQHL